VAGIIGIILYQLYDIGWMEVLRSLPSEPLFYILFLILYVTLPVAEVLIYKQVWTFKAWEGFKVFITKKVYNDEVMGYTGEVYLYTWGRKLAGLSDKDVLKNIRDNSILSAVNSNVTAFLLIGVLISAGQVKLADLIGNVNYLYVFLGIFITAVLIVLFIQFRQYLFDLPLKKAATIFGIYTVRFAIHHALLMLSWAVVIPDTPLNVWFTFLATIIVVNRIPFIPSKDLVFVWFGIELSKMLNMATASVAGMLLVFSALTKITNLILFTLISVYSEAKELNDLPPPGENELPVDQPDQK